MLFLSQLLNKSVFFQGRPYGKVIDMAVFINKTDPPISKIEILQGKNKLTIPPNTLRIEKGTLTLTSNDFPHLPYDHQDLYLSEDLLDKQVIDIDGRRLVRVNDVVLENGRELRVAGIDIGFDGILRRLGLGMIHLKPQILPWNLIEAFDYDTGNIKIKLTQNSLASLHPADLADILEEAGTKERLGIVESLDARQAARAIEEADEETQVSILENLTPDVLKNVINKMHVSQLADVFQDLNPIKSQEIQKVLDVDRLKQVQTLSRFSDTVAGGLMHQHFLQRDGETTVKELLEELKQPSYIPEVVVVTDNKKYLGIIHVKDLLHADKLARLKDIISEKKYIAPYTSFDEILRIFAQYNLRVIPVIDKDRLPIGIVMIDEVIQTIQEENERDENL